MDWLAYTLCAVCLLWVSVSRPKSILFLSHNLLGSVSTTTTNAYSDVISYHLGYQMCFSRAARCRLPIIHQLWPPVPPVYGLTCVYPIGRSGSRRLHAQRPVRLPAEYSMLHYVTHGWRHTAAARSERLAVFVELRHVRLLQHVNICCSKTIYAAGGDVTQRWRHTPRRLLRMRAAAYCSILHYAAGTEQASVHALHHQQQVCLPLEFMLENCCQWGELVVSDASPTFTRNRVRFPSSTLTLVPSGYGA